MKSRLNILKVKYVNSALISQKKKEVQVGKNGILIHRKYGNSILDKQKKKRKTICPKNYTRFIKGQR